jgi:hypothetical protein
MLTNLSKLACVLSLFFGVIGCGDTETMTSMPDLPAVVVHDMAQSTSGGGGDMAHATTGGDGGGSLLPLCSICTGNTECASGSCVMYNNGTKKCSHSCTPATAATDCPGVNQCNNQVPAVCKCM